MNLKKLLLLCGLFVPIVYIGMDLFTGLNYPGYSFINQAISELSAIGSPTKQIWDTVMSLTLGPLLIAFGVGVFSLAKKLSLKLTGIMLWIWGISGYIWFFFPMNMRETVGSFTDTMHLVMAGLTVLIITLLITAGAFAYSKAFRFYSIITIIIMLVFGSLVSIQAPNIATHLPTPGMGILERISVYSSMIWVGVLSASLLNLET